GVARPPAEPDPGAHDHAGDRDHGGDQTEPPSRPAQTVHHLYGYQRLATRERETSGDPPASLLTNWAGNVVYGAAQTATPATVDEVRQIVAASTLAKAGGSGHSFRAIASTSGTVISTPELARIDPLSPDRSVR